ncbi:MAG: restriction endonuclease subunit S [Nitrospiraceae bacterium]
MIAKASGVETPHSKRSLPDGWRWVRLGEVCEEQTGTRDPRSEALKQFRYVDITSVDNRTKRMVDPKTLVGREAPSRARQVIRKSDVLVSTTRPNLNAVALVPSGLDDEIASTGFCVLRPKSALNPSYLFGFVQSAEFVQCLSDLVKGALYPAVTDKQVRDQFIPLPPLAEQKRIAAILNEQMAVVDRARAAAEVQLEAAKALPAAYLRAVFNSQEARQWPRRRLGEVCELLPSKSIATDGDAEVLAITTASLTESGFEPSGVKQARMWANDVTECVVSPGEILIARSNTPDLVGRVAMFSGNPKEAVASDLTIRLRGNGDRVNSAFLTAYLSFLYLTGYWKERAGGASGSMKKITRTQIQEERVPAPPISEQGRIAAVLKEQMAVVERTRKALDEQLDTITKLPATLLRMAFNGEI